MRLIDTKPIMAELDRAERSLINPDEAKGVRLAEFLIGEAPIVETKPIKYFDEDEKVWKIGNVIIDRKDEPKRRCDECAHFDRPYKTTNKDGMIVIGVECDGMDGPCDEWTDEPQTDCAWR